MRFAVVGCEPAKPAARAAPLARIPAPDTVELAEGFVAHKSWGHVAGRPLLP